MQTSCSALPLVTLTCLGLFFGASAHARQPDLSANIGIANDYVFRGVSQTNGRAQISGGVDATAGGLYAGAWTSNVDFGNSTTAEIDLYAGLRPTVGKVSLDLGVLYYGYVDAPKGSDLNFTELKAAASLPVGKATVGLMTAYAPNYQGGLDHALYYEANAAAPLSDRVMLSAAVGRQTVSGPADYATWNVGLAYALTKTLSLDVRYHDTDDHSLGKTYGRRVAASLKASF